MTDFLHMKELLHILSQGLLYPIMFVLGVLVIYILWSVAGVLHEAITERRHYKAVLPELLAEIDAAPYGQLFDVISRARLLDRQVKVLQTLVAYGYLPEADRVALAKKLASEAQTAYSKTTSRTDLVAKVAPMFGLMGTLIPLGPGIVALGQGQTELLASSIEIAFDTTVAGLIVAAIALFVSRWRKRWYREYLAAIEACMSAILQKAHEAHEAGEHIGDAQSAARSLETLNAGSARRSRRKDGSLHGELAGSEGRA